MATNRLTSPVIQLGRDGLLAGSAPARVPVEPRPDDEPRQRKALICEARAAIAVALRCGFTYGQIGELIGRDKPAIWCEVNFHRGPDDTYW